MSWSRIRERSYRFVLAVQPENVRLRYGEEWLATALERDADAWARGLRHGWRHWVKEMGGGLAAAARGRAGRRERSRGFGPRKTREGWMMRMTNDLRYGLRSLLRTPGFTFAAVAVLGVGIGATTVMYSAVHAVLFAPLPF